MPILTPSTLLDDKQQQCEDNPFEDEQQPISSSNDDEEEHVLVSDEPTILANNTTTDSDPIETADPSSSPEKLGMTSMMVLLFYGVSGGPFGIEPTVRAGGNLFALLGFLVLPFVWSLPEALMTAELGTAFPHDASGGVVWVEQAFGPSLGFISGFLSWISGATDNSIYPVLFMDYLLQVVGKDDDNGDNIMSHPLIRLGLVTSITISLTYVNWRGLALVGKLSILIAILAMSPFVILILVGSWKVDPSRWFELPNYNQTQIIADNDENISGGLFPNFTYGGVLWRPFLNNLFWCLNSFDAGAIFVSEVESTKSYVRAMIWSVPIVAVGYFFPILVAIGASDSQQSDWTDGYMATLNAQIVGPWLGVWTVFAAAISNIGLFQAELSGDAYTLMGMADRGYLPQIFRQRSKYGTPTAGLVLGASIIIAMGTLSDFEKLIELLNCNYGISLLLEYAAFFRLRVTQPNLSRPYKIPLGTWGCALLFLPTVITTLFVLSLGTYATWGFAIGSWIVGYGLYWFRQKQQNQQRRHNRQTNEEEEEPEQELLRLHSSTSINSNTNSRRNNDFVHRRSRRTLSSVIPQFACVQQ